MSLRQSGDRSKATVEALIGCLVAPGDRARRAAADALCRITGRNWTYPAHVTDEEKQAVVRQWKDWWAKARAAYRPPPTTKPG
jgi:hypothetical protein